MRHREHGIVSLSFCLVVLYSCEKPVVYFWVFTLVMVPVASDSCSSSGMIFISLVHTSQNMQLTFQLPQSFHMFIDKKFICLRQRNLPNTLLLNLPSSFMDMLLSSGAALLDGSFLEYSRNCLKSLLPLGECKPHCSAAWCGTMKV